MTSEFVFMLQMDAEAEDKTLCTRSKGTKGELGSMTLCPPHREIQEF